MLDVVAPLAHEVRVLHAGSEAEWREGNITAIAAPQRMRLHLARRLFRLAFRPLVGRDGWGQELALWWHFDRRFDPRFRRQVRDLVRWSDAILLEYSFWAWAVEAEIRRQRRPVPFILTAHDVLADNVTSSAWLRRLTFLQEVAALRSADHAVCVSESDAAAFSARGIATEVIPNPVDLDTAQTPPALEPRTMLEALFDVRLPEGPFCLFVGSDYGPNRAAVAEIRAIAKAMPIEARASFVLAGGCAPPGRDGAVLALGRVEDQVLAALYTLAAVVVIPLTQGSGTSLKTVEAMAWGRPILGTSAAFRGLPVTPGLNCEQEDDLTRWPTRLAGMLADPARRLAMGAAARRLAEDFGHRRVFAAYLRLLGLPSAAGSAIVASDSERRRKLKEVRPLIDRAIARERLDLAAILIDALRSKPVACDRSSPSTTVS
jgi:glycosyltransferase involved in cell wall biosynthesis